MPWQIWTNLQQMTLRFWSYLQIPMKMVDKHCLLETPAQYWLSLCPLGNCACFFVVCWFFSKSSFLKNSFRNTIWVSNGLNPDQAWHFVGPDLGPICLQRLLADDTRRQRVNKDKFMIYGADIKSVHVTFDPLLRPWSRESETVTLHIASLWWTHVKYFKNRTRSSVGMEQSQILYMWPLTFHYDRDLEARCLKPLLCMLSHWGGHVWTIFWIRQGVQQVWSSHKFCTCDLWPSTMTLTLKQGV